MQLAIVAAHVPLACSPALRSCVSPAPLAARRGAMRSPCPTTRRVATVAALPGSDALPLDGATKEELPQWLTLVGYAASMIAAQAKISSFQLAASHIYLALAWYTLAWGVLTLANQAKGTDAVGGTIGPVFLAVNALDGFGKISPLETAAFLFGFLWIEKLPSFSYSHWVWLATLVGAIYKGMPAQWLVGAFGVSALWKLVEQYRQKSSVRYQEVAFVALAGFAFYKQVEMPVALMIMVAQMVSSTVA